MFKTKKIKPGFGEEPSTPKFQSVSLPQTGGGDSCTPTRPTTPWFDALSSSSPRPATPRPIISRAATPQPYTPLKSCLKMTGRTMTTTGIIWKQDKKSRNCETNMSPFQNIPHDTREKTLYDWRRGLYDQAEESYKTSHMHNWYVGI